MREFQDCCGRLKQGRPGFEVPLLMDGNMNYFVDDVVMMMIDSL